MKIGYNENTAMGCSTLELDLKICEKIGYDFIEVNLEMLKIYLMNNSEKDLKYFFLNNRIKPHAFNSIDNINFLDSSEWKKTVDDFILACKIGEKIGSHYIVVVPALLNKSNKCSEREIF